MQFTSRILIMKNLQTTIREKLNRTKSFLMLEKLKINSKSKINNEVGFTKKEEDNIIMNLCKYFQSSASYDGHEYKTRLDIVDKHFNKDICKFFDHYDFWEDITMWINVDDEINQNDVDKLRDYIEENNDELYQEIKDFVL